MQTIIERGILISLKEHIRGDRPGHKITSGFLQHPLVSALDKTMLAPEQLIRFCQLRYSAASRFELLLIRAIELALDAGEVKKPLADELQMNLDDEQGKGRAQEDGAHSVWRADFLHGIGVKTVSGQDMPELYVFHPHDSLGTLAGMLLAAEYTIPPEDKRVLKSLRRSFPNKFTSTSDEGTALQRLTSRYLVDHIQHDAQMHFPDLLKAIVTSLSSAQETGDLLQGIRRFADERSHFYTFIQQSLDLELLPMSRRENLRQ